MKTQRCRISHVVRGLALVSLAMCLFSCSVFTRGGRLARFESWLPADTTALISVRDAQTARQKWAKTAMGDAWSDPAAAYWRTQQLDPVIDEFIKRAGLGEERKILPLITGQALVGMRVEGRKTTPSFFAIADFGQNSSQVRLPQAQKSETAAWAGNILIMASDSRLLADLVDREKARRSLFRKTPPSLQSSDTWREITKLNNVDGDAYIYADVAAIYNALLPLGEATMMKHDLGVPFLSLRMLAKALGMESAGVISASVQMRDKGFYTRSLLTYRNGQPGVFAPPPMPKELQTPLWMTRNLSSFSAVQIRSPHAIEKSLTEMLTEENPLLGQAVKAGKRQFEKQVGVKLDTLTGALGSEVAIVGNEGELTPEYVLLWQIRDSEDLDKSLEKLQKAWKGTSQSFSFSGYTYEKRTFRDLPMPIYTARVGNFFMVSGQDKWLKDFATRRAQLAASIEKPDPKLPAGPNSLLPVLEGPFGKTPVDMTVVGRSFYNPGPDLIKTSAMLPLAIPMVNMQLQRQDMPTIPQWVTKAIPPLLPFARNSFPTVRRTMQKNTEYTIDESYSAFDPLASPLAASALVIVGKEALELEAKR